MIINRPLGDYVLIKKIATGGMAEIFLARQRGARPPKGLVALKKIMSSRASDEDFLRMFRNEAALGAHLDHPHVVKLSEVIEVDGQDCMVLEFVHGLTLEELIEVARAQGRELPLEAALWLVMKACEGLDHIHNLTDERGQPLQIVHRDISPQNILVSFDAQVKIFDFGIADSTLTPDNIRDGAMAGKVAYMSPEQCRGERLDARSDLFSIAIVLWELTTGARLFKRDNQIQTINAIVEGDYQKPSDARPDFPPALEPIIMAALAPNRDDRTPSCLAFRMALNKFLDAHQLSPQRHQISDLMRELFAKEDAEFQALIDAVNALPEPGGRPLRRGDPAEAEINAAVEAALAEDRALNAARASAAFDSFISEPSNPRASSSHPSNPRAPASHPSNPLIPLNPGPTSPRALPAQPTPHPVTLVSLAPQPQPEAAAGLPRALVIVGAASLGLALLVVAALAWVMLSDTTTTTSAPQTSSTPTSGTLVIETLPEGAQITLSGRQLSVLTPTSVPGIPFGEPVVITLEKPGYLPAQREVSFSPDNPNQALKVDLKPDASPNQGVGGLYVLTQPADARIFLNNKKLADQTPVTFNKIPADVEHALRISRDGYKDEIIPFTVKRNEIKDFEIELSQTEEVAALAQLTLLSEPSGCRVTINGEFYGKTEILNLLVPALQPLDIEVSCPDFGTWNRQIQLNPDEEHTLRAALGLAAKVDPEAGTPAILPPVEETPPPETMATLSVSTEPATRVSANGRLLGTTPLSDLKLKPGRTLLTFSNDASNITYSQRVSLVAGASEKIDLKIPTGTVKVTSDLDALVFVNGAQIGQAPIDSHTLYAGLHKIRVDAPSLGYSREYRIRVLGGESRSINTRFQEIRVTRLREDPPKADPGEPQVAPQEPDAEPDPGGDQGTKDPLDDKARDEGASPDGQPLLKEGKSPVKEGQPPGKKPPGKKDPLDEEPYPLLR